MGDGGYGACGAGYHQIGKGRMWVRRCDGACGVGVKCKKSDARCGKRGFRGGVVRYVLMQGVRIRCMVYEGVGGCSTWRAKLPGGGMRDAWGAGVGGRRVGGELRGLGAVVSSLC